MQYGIKHIEDAERLNPGTEIILAIIYAVSKDKPKDEQKKYAKIMREVLEISGVKMEGVEE